MEPNTFTELRTIIYRESGINLDHSKVSLLSNRLFKRLRALGIANEIDYLKFLKSDKTGNELSKLIDVISTNHTYFYREPEHFDILKQILRKEHANSHKLRLWCAAASSGEEPYTLAITVMEAMNLRGVDFKLLATDICSDVLARAQKAIYRDNQMSHTPAEIKRKYFTENQNNNETEWSVNSDVQQFITFRKMNLIQFPYPLKGPIDIIFCRNVMIYFDVPTRAKIIREMFRLLAPGGYFFLSMSENLLGVDHSFERFANCVYRKPSAGGNK